MASKGWGTQPQPFSKPESRICNICEKPAGQPAYARQTDDGRWHYCCLECADGLYHGDDAQGIAAPREERVEEKCSRCGALFFLPDPQEEHESNEDKLCEGCSAEDWADVEDVDV
jgi:hypothetical protein